MFERIVRMIAELWELLCPLQAGVWWQCGLHLAFLVQDIISISVMLATDLSPAEVWLPPPVTM